MSDTASRVRLPYGFATVGDHRLVQLVDPERLDWQQGFFIRSLPRENPFVAIVSLDEWLQQGTTGHDFSGVGGIFHVSRCGSTLLGQNLKATGRAVVLSEPPFMRVLRTRLDGALSREKSVAAMALAMAQWHDWAASQCKALVVKFNSQMHQWADDILTALPGARFMFLHRDPAPVFESIERGPPRYLQREAGESRHAGMAELDGLDEDPILLAAARRYCGSLAVFSGTAAQVPQVAYADLADSFPAICRHFGLSPDQQWDSSRNAKAADPHGNTDYRPVSESRLGNFVRQHKPLLELVNARYAAFLDQPGGRENSMGGSLK